MYIYTYVYREVKSKRVAENCSVSARGRGMGGISAYKCILIYSALKPILWEICSDTYTMFKIERPDHRNGVCNFKRKWWHDSDAKRDQDAKGKSAAMQDAEVDGDESPAKKSKKDKGKEIDTKTAPNKKNPKKD